MAEHSTLTGADLHEPKGAAAAAINTTYVANGAGSGSWQKIKPEHLHSNVLNVNKGKLYVEIPDISTASKHYVTFGNNAVTITRITTVLGGAITVADSIITFRKQGSTSMGTITVAFTGSAEGDIDTLAPSGAAASIVADGFIEIDNDGGSTTAQPVGVTIDYTLTS